MANPSPSIPPSVWDEYIQRIEADIAEMQSGSGDDLWQDVTEEGIEYHKRTIATYDRILAGLAKKQTP